MLSVCNTQQLYVYELNITTSRQTWVYPISMSPCRKGGMPGGSCSSSRCPLRGLNTSCHLLSPVAVLRRWPDHAPAARTTPLRVTSLKGREQACNTPARQRAKHTYALHSSQIACLMTAFMGLSLVALAVVRPVIKQWENPCKDRLCTTY